MPYRNAPYYVLICIAVIVAGFWPSYFAAGESVPWQFHAHGIAASIWVLMVLAQSWTVHKEQLPLHRAVGKSSLILFPFLIAGLAAIIDLTAKGFVSGEGLTRQLFGGQFLIGLALAIAAYVTLYYRALKYRRKVWLHSGYMLATPLILFESPFSRLMSMVLPPFAIEGPQHFDRLIPSILWAMAVSLAIIAAIWFAYRDKASPFLVAGAFIVAQMLTMGLMADSAVLEAMLTMLAMVPSAVVWLAGFAIGALTSWAGWNAGKRPAVTMAAQAA
ncbi:MAG: hypothetical protein M3Q19_08945 [Pseudomonadota bacterium]|nr:hypothetical protein [Pseudomonadota bacterium]